MIDHCLQGRIQDFKLGGGGWGGGARNKIAPSGANIFWVFRVKNHDFTPKKSKNFAIAEGGTNIFGVFRVKNHDFMPKNHIFFQLRREARTFLGYFV